MEQRWSQPFHWGLLMAFDATEPFEPPSFEVSGPENKDCGFVQGHPRDVRIIPKSRDFH